MIDNKTIMFDPNNREIWCYGEISWDSNFNVVCDDEANDVIVPGLETEEGEPPTTWKQVVAILFKDGFYDMEQIETC
ncbi:MAG: hypothetical protein ACTSQB_00290 [Candidatus Heimdallarchaeota archaeon]